MRRNAALAVLLAGCLHEFVWQAFPWQLQGDVRSITQWFLILALCVALGGAAKDRFVWGCCTAVALMSSTTAACTVAWLSAPWPIEPGTEQCSAHWGVPMLLVSGLAAVAVIAWGGRESG